MKVLPVIRNAQKGVALIMVLIIIALITIIATQLVTERNLHARRTSNILLADNAWQYALGAEILAKIAIVKSLKNEDTVNLGQPWAMEGIIFPIEGGAISAELKDLRSCFNLNGVLLELDAEANKDDEKPVQENNKPLPGEKVFAELLIALELQDVQPEALAARVRDWIDKDQQPAGFEGREDYEYTGYNLPYRTADTLLGSRTELAAVSGFSADLVARILPYVCVIPGVTELVLNINTIPIDQPELLSSFYDHLDTNAALSILNARIIDGYDQSSYNEQLPAEAKLHEGVRVEFSSPYFSVVSNVQLGRARVSLKSLLHYQAESNDVTILARLGVDD
jgi:general secretion pathway protein K